MGLIIKNGIEYIGGGGSGNALEEVLTQAEYDALGDEKYTNNITYYITDSEELSAENIAFDGSSAGLKADTVQEVIFELNDKIDNFEGSGAKDVAIPLLLDDWVLNETDDTYYQVISIEDLAETSNPLIMLSPADEEASNEELESYACIADMVVSENAIKFIASEKPAISFTVIAKNVIAAKNDAAIADMTNLVSRVSDIEQELKDVAVALLVDNWVLDEEAGTYSQSVDMEGLSGDAAPIICAAADSELDYFICISETIVEDNKITFIADELPEASFTAIVKGATVNEVDQVADLTEIVGRLREIESNEALVEVVLPDTTTILAPVPYPNGFNYDNCYVSSAWVKHGTSDVKYYLLNESLQVRLQPDTVRFDNRVTEWAGFPAYAVLKKLPTN